MNQLLVIETLKGHTPVAMVSIGGRRARWACLEPILREDLESFLRIGLKRGPYRLIREAVGAEKRKLLARPILRDDPAYPQAVADRLTYHSADKRFVARVAAEDEVSPGPFEALAMDPAAVAKDSPTGGARSGCACEAAPDPWTPNCSVCGRPNEWSRVMLPFREDIEQAIAKLVSETFRHSQLYVRAGHLLTVLQTSARAIWPSPSPGMTVEVYRVQVADFCKLAFSLPGVDRTFASSLADDVRRLPRDWMHQAVAVSRSIQGWSNPGLPIDANAMASQGRLMASEARGAWGEAVAAVSRLPAREAKEMRRLEILRRGFVEKVRLPESTVFGRIKRGLRNLAFFDPSELIPAVAANIKASRLEVCRILIAARTSEDSRLAAMQEGLSQYLVRLAAARFNALGSSQGAKVAKNFLSKLGVKETS